MKYFLAGRKTNSIMKLEKTTKENLTEWLN